MLGSKSTAYELRRKAKLLMDKAREQEQAGDLKQAGILVAKAAETLRKTAEYEQVMRDQARIYAKAKELDQMAVTLASGKPVFNEALGRGSKPLPVGDEYTASVDELEYKSPVTWADIGGMTEVKSTLKFVMGTMLARHPEGVDLGIGRRILLYGPPGTGKTLLAAACSNMLGAAFFNVKASDLLSKYFGDSTKLISALFARARDRATGGAAVVFIDEIESLGGDRNDGNQTGPERRIISTLLSELDGMAEKGTPSGVITIAATNDPESMDEAILQRFQKHIYVALPDTPARRAIFDVQITGRGMKLAKDVSYDELASKTEWYSGRLINNICNEAVEKMIREENHSVPSHVDNGTINDYILQYRPLTAADFKQAMSKVKPTSNEATVQRYDTWAKHVGGDRI